MSQLAECKEWQVCVGPFMNGVFELEKSTSVFSFRVCVQVMMCGCTYMVLFTGNFLTTLAVVYQKYRNNQGKSKSL